MNYQRIEMEKRLPPGSQLLCSHLWGKINEAGVKIAQEDVVLLSRIVCDYILNTADGKKTALKLLNATVQKPDERHAYHPVGKTENIKVADLIQYSGWIYRGSVGIPTTQIEVDKNGSLEACDDTGIWGPKDFCIQTVKDYGSGGREVLKTLSNYARLLSENHRIRETASADKCKTCLLRDCAYHQSKEPKQLMLVSPGA